MSEWKEIELADIIDVKHGYAFPGENIHEDPPGDILLTPGNFAIGGGFKGSKFKYFNGEVTDEYVLKEGDLIVTMTDLSKQADTLGYPALVPKPPGVRFLHNQRLGKVIIHGNAGIDKKFLFYLLRTRDYRNEVLASATGTTVKHTSPARILAHKVTLPPLQEQRAIAHILGTLDDKIELNRRMNETLEAKARAIFKSWFVNFDPVHAKSEGRDTGLPKIIADLFPDSFEDSELGEIPKGWGIGNLLKSAKLLSGGTPKTGHAEYWNGEIPWASAKDVSQCSDGFLIDTERKITALGLNESSTQLIPAYSTVIVARGATTGRMVILGRSMAMNQTCYALTSTVATPFSLYCQSCHGIDALVNQAHGSVFDTITTSTFMSSRILIMPFLVTQAFESFTSPLFYRILKNIEESSTFKSLRDTVLPKLISGELRVKDAERFKGKAA